MHLDNEIAAKQSQCNIGLENNILLFRAAIQALEDFDFFYPLPYKNAFYAIEAIAF